MNTILQKIDRFMERYVLPTFQPQQIRWLFSLSGGKDSYAMCEGVRAWYEAHGWPLDAYGIHIWQWGETDPAPALRSAFPWLRELQVMDARSCTDQYLGGTDQQAPCRACSDIRHCFSDRYLEQLRGDRPVFLCRGLHLTDMAISILWRLTWYGPGDHLGNKGHPLVPLFPGVYLAKPLCFAREYECQTLANALGHTPFVCPCPAQRYPSRRDIVEESLRLFYTGPLWEYDIPGMDTYLTRIAGPSSLETLRTCSLPGQEQKTPSIPQDYFSFALSRFLQAPIPRSFSNTDQVLEQFISGLLSKGQVTSPVGPGYSCKLWIAPDELSHFDLHMIGTLGPFWGSIALPPEQRLPFHRLQRELWDFHPDQEWGQVYHLMRQYYQSFT